MALSFSISAQCFFCVFFLINFWFLFYSGDKGGGTNEALSLWHLCLGIHLQPARKRGKRSEQIAKGWRRLRQNISSEITENCLWQWLVPEGHICAASKCAHCKWGNACAWAEPTTSEQAPNHTSTIRGVLSSLVPAAEGTTAPPGQVAHFGRIAL